MKNQITFNIPEEEIELQMALNASKLHCVITELDNKLRNMHKYENKKNISIEFVRKMIQNEINNYSLNNLFD
jgi:hypothetical protein